MDNPSGLGFEPEAYVDITPVMETKEQMLLPHEARTPGSERSTTACRLPTSWKATPRRGAEAGVAFAESFREVKTYPPTGSFALLPGFGA